MRIPLTDLDARQTTLDASGETPSPSRAGPRIRQVRSHGLTHPGRVRRHNEDQFLVAVLTRALQTRQTSLRQEEVYYSDPQGYLFLVADGVGGAAAGGYASALAVNTVENFVLETLNWCIKLRGAEGENVCDKILEEFRHALEQADDRLFQESQQHPELHGMGTTLTLAYAFADELFLAHVGDSRCYLLRKGLLYRLTRDHTLVDEMVRRGMLQPEEAAHHYYRHVITNVVGGSNPGVRVEVHKLPLDVGDRLLLCSDGLTEMVSDDEILGVLREEAEPGTACERLVARANEQGGRDNVTAVVAHFE